MNTLTHIMPRGGVVTFPSAPKYGTALLVEMPTQRHGRDSAGLEYVYQRRADKTRNVHRLSWQNITKTVLDALLLFYQTAQGTKHTFIWIDHLADMHSVYFSSEQINWKQTGPDRYNVVIALEEPLVIQAAQKQAQAVSWQYLDVTFADGTPVTYA